MSKATDNLCPYCDEGLKDMGTHLECLVPECQSKFCKSCGEELVPGEAHFCITEHDCKKCMGDCQCKAQQAA